MIIVTGGVTTTPDNHDAILALSLEHVKRSRTEPGCMAHNVHVDCENQNRLVFLEYWLDAAALKTHFAVPASLDFVENVRQLASGTIEMAIFDSQPWPVS
ncbi:putative quinol monooxygenase [Hyphomonas oceanitis]|uniref:putative quinol monooxygenase n=1 Tax=Hyphomonas oceanitis TaxID=81033 RepID=UPI003002C861